MKRLGIICLLAVAWGLTGCADNPESAGLTDERMLSGSAANPVGDPETNPYRPSSPILLDVPAGGEETR